MSLRNGVDYGVPGNENIKRVGVPYEAADVPSKRSEYSHPDVATFLSFFSYFNKGLSYLQFEEALNCLHSLNESSKKYYFLNWISLIED